MGEKKLMKFELDNKNVKIKELLNGQFLELECYVISDANPNRNMSHFTLDSMKEALPLFKNRPVLGAFNDMIGPDGDFMGHEDNGLKFDPEFDSLYYDYIQKKGKIIEVPLGTIRESDPIEIVFDKKTGLHWIKLHCALWTAYNYKAIKSLLKSRKGRAKISVEVEIEESEMEGNIENILRFIPLGFTILGSRPNGQQIEEGIEGAHLTVLDFIENELFARKAKALHYAYSALENYNSNSNVNNNVETSSQGDENNPEQNSNIDNNIQNFSQTSDDDSDIINEAPEEQITMQVEESQKGGNNEMLTMNEKRDLLDNYLRTNRLGEDEYGWVCDLTDNEVFYNICGEKEGDVYYRASYVIVEDEEGHPVATIDTANEVRVVKRWTDFAEEVCPDCNESPCVCEKHEHEVESCEPKEDNACGNKEDNACGNKEDNACGNKEDNACGDKEEEACGDKEAECNFEDKPNDSDDSDDSDDEDDDNDDPEDNKENEAKCDECKFEEDNAPIQTGEEPTEPAGEGLTPEEGVKAASKSVCAPEIQTESENNGDAAKTVEEEMPENAPADEAHVAEAEGSDNEAVGEGPDGQKAEVIPEENLETKVEQPNDEDKEKLYSFETVNVNGENIDIHALYEKFTAIVVEYEDLNKQFEETKTNYENLQNQIKAETAKKLVEFGKNFVNTEDDVDAETKAQFVRQIEEKCMNFEFNSEDDVTKFAKTSIAMYLYEKRSSKKNNNSVIMPKNVNPKINSSNRSNEAYDEAFNKLSKI